MALPMREVLPITAAVRENKQYIDIIEKKHWNHSYPGIPLPENVRAVEVECGLQHLVYVSWQVSILV